MRFHSLLCCLTGALLLAATARACDLRVSDAWIREPIPGAASLAGYAQLYNSGSSPLVIGTLRSTTFTRIEMHESVQSSGVMQMRPLPSISLAAHESVRFAPDGKHFMLIGPSRRLQRGDAVSIELIDGSGCVTKAQFNVGAGSANSSAPAMNMGSMK